MARTFRSLMGLVVAIGVASACGSPQAPPPPAPQQPVGPRADAPNAVNFVAEQYLVLEPGTDPAKPCVLSLQDPSSKVEKQLHTGQGRNVMWVLENNCDKDATLTLGFGTDHPLVRIPGKADKGIRLASGDLHFLAGRIKNKIAGTFPVTFSYTVTLKYDGKTYAIDPDIIIEF